VSAAGLEIRSAVLAYRERTVATGFSLVVPCGRITAIVGPNGSGKSTVLRALARILKPQTGQVLLDGVDIHHIATDEVARRLAILPQSPQAPEGLTVFDLVSFGRFPYRSWLSGADPAGDTPVHKALAAVGISSLSERPVSTLSGGQRQRAWIAMALAQETKYLLLDEPTTFLDPAHQMEMMDLVRKLNVELDKTVVLVLHDLNLAARYADHIVMLKDGRIAAQGDPASVLTDANLRHVFDIEAHVVRDENGSIITCTPVRALGQVDPD
jgi:iron complex transport system ATP-binding protein